MLETDVAKQLVKSPMTAFFLRRNFCVVPNVSWGLFRWGEADVLGLTKSDYFIEAEIKLSQSDLRADKHKAKWRNAVKHKQWLATIKRFYYVVPLELRNEALLICGKYGVIWFNKRFSFFYSKISEDNKEAKKVDEKTKLNLLRLGCFRIWKT